jgi:membrane protein implicated in regulation of membrane protease activity
MAAKLAYSAALFTEDGNVYRGSILLKGEIWQATATQPIQFGDDVSVRQIRGMKLEVEPTETAVVEQEST